MKPLPGVGQLPYMTTPLHGFLDEHAARPEGPNIGLRGEHLTITFLSCNRFELSLRLLHSIAEQMPDFAGEVLIFDNGSSGSTIERLKAFIDNSPLRIRVIRSATNLGVARGRNRSVEEIGTSWVMSLDNDIVFTGDPRPTVQREIAQLGCKFLSLPLMKPDRKTYFAFGGHLHLRLDEKNLVAVAGGGAFAASEPTPGAGPTLGTFLFGTACFFEAAAFQACGGFDEALFVGFEDIDFSIRLFRSGLKVGCSGGSFLVHDHPHKANAEADYERTRFSRTHIEAAARHLEKKHGYSFWNSDLLEWLDTKLPDGQIEPARSAIPRVALIIDVENWAFDNIAKQLRRHLGASFEFETFAANGLKPGTLASLLHGFDLVHFLSRGALTAVWAAAEAGHSIGGWPVAELVANIERRSTITVGVYDHLYLSMEDLGRYTADPYWYGIHIQRFRSMHNKVEGYYVSSARLFDIYSKVGDIPPPECSLPDGVDLSLFHPDKKTRSGGPLRVGWSGNSAWMDHQGDLDPKGLRTTLRPVIDLLRNEGVSIELVLADRHVRLIPHKQMPGFYNSLDVFVCSSQSEGTPNPVLEAMACGIPVISTDVGIVPEAFGPRQKRFILPRSVNAFADALRTLAADHQLRVDLSAENLISIQCWDWSRRAADIGQFFKRMMARKERRTGATATRTTETVT
jgi:glycosyltransferase involved in cell wall biosynthesis